MLITAIRIIIKVILTEDNVPDFNSVIKEKGFVGDSDVLTELVVKDNKQYLKISKKRPDDKFMFTTIHKIRIVKKIVPKHGYTGLNSDEFPSLILSNKTDQSILERLELRYSTQNYYQFIEEIRKLYNNETMVIKEEYYDLLEKAIGPPGYSTELPVGTFETAKKKFID